MKIGYNNIFEIFKKIKERRLNVNNKFIIKIVSVIIILFLTKNFSLIVKYPFVSVNYTGEGWIVSIGGNYSSSWNSEFESVSFTNNNYITNLLFYFNGLDSVKRNIISLIKYFIYPYYLNYHVLIENRDLDKYEREYVDDDWLIRKIIFNFPYPIGVNEKDRLIIFPDFSNELVNRKNKTFYYLYMFRKKFTFTYLPVTNLKNDIGGLYNSYLKFGDKLVSVSFFSKNNKKEFFLKKTPLLEYEEGGVFSRSYSLDKDSLIFPANFSEVVNINDILTTSPFYISVSKNTKSFSTFCEYNKSVNNRFFGTRIDLKIYTNKGVSERRDDYFVIGPNTVVYVESMEIN